MYNLAFIDIDTTMVYGAKHYKKPLTGDEIELMAMPNKIYQVLSVAEGDIIKVSVRDIESPTHIPEF